MKRKEIKYAGKLDTKEDLSGFDMPALTKRRKRAEEMGLAGEVARIDAARRVLKTATGTMSEREMCFQQVFGRVPEPGRSTLYRSEFSAERRRLLLEIPETEIIPAVGEQRTRRVKWVWEKSGNQMQRDRATARSSGNLKMLEALEKLREDLASASQGGSEVYLVLYRPYRESGKAFRMPPVLGNVEVVKSGAFRVEFFDQNLHSPGLHPKPIVEEGGAA